MLARRFFWLGPALVLATSGCTYTLNANLYDTSGGPPLQAVFKWNGSGRGPVGITLPSGEHCTGEYVTVSNADTTWGQLYTVASASGGGMATVSTTGYAVSSGGEQRGRAIAAGPSGTTIECEYVTGASSPHGYGSCRDNRAKVYRLMF